ncbi:MAG: MFS transporter [Chloroflexi bacterium]|nr:MFS transporter [Chloroflexota bacterium]
MRFTSTGGVRTFLTVWLGQLVSIVGSGMTDFALGLYVYQRTQSVTQFALILLCRALPVILISPVAGALVDRWDKRTVMLCSDIVAAFSTLALAVLFISNQLQIWHIYLGVMSVSAAGVFQVPAYLTATTALIPSKHLSRASGMVQVAQACAEIVSPLLAGLLMGAIQVQGVLLADTASFGFSVLTLLVVRFPPTIDPVRDERSAGTLKGQIVEGLTYIRRRPALVTLLAFFAAVYLEGAMIGALIQPLALAFTSPAGLGAILTAGGSGLMLGGIFLSTWGGPVPRINGVLGFLFLFGSGIVLVGLRPSPLLAGIGAFFAHFCMPFVNGCNQAIWQESVPLSLQGRVFAVRQMAARGAQLLALVVVGPLADRAVAPLMNADGLLAGSVGQVIGVGAGRGIALIFVLMGLLAMLTAGIGWLSPRLRCVEAELVRAGVVTCDK